MMMHHRVQQNRSRKRSKRSVGRYFRTRLTRQTWLRPITIYLHRWDTRFLTSASLLTKMYENASTTGLPQKSDSFFGVASTNCQTGGKNVKLAMGDASNKIFLIIFRFRINTPGKVPNEPSISQRCFRRMFEKKACVATVADF